MWQNLVLLTLISLELAMCNLPVIWRLCISNSCNDLNRYPCSDARVLAQAKTVQKHMCVDSMEVSSLDTMFFQLIRISGTKFTNEKKFMTCKGWLIKKNSHHNHGALQNQWTKIPKMAKISQKWHVPIDNVKGYLLCFVVIKCNLQKLKALKLREWQIQCLKLDVWCKN